MKKRVAVILLVICILPATLAAATPFFQFGPLVSYNKTVVELDDENAWKDINNFSFGADVRLNPIKWLSIDIPATIGFGSKGSFSIALLPKSMQIYQSILLTASASISRLVSVRSSISSMSERLRNGR